MTDKTKTPPSDVKETFFKAAEGGSLQALKGAPSIHGEYRRSLKDKMQPCTIYLMQQKEKNHG